MSKLLLILLFVLLLGALPAKTHAQNFDKKNYYAVLKSGKMADVNAELDLVTSSSISEKEAYEGVLLMRKAALQKIPVDKLKMFKKGRIKLETAIANDNSNGEYHFLRFMIEENAPKIAKYHADLDTDKEHIKKSYKNLSPAVQQAIIDYSKNSKILQPQDF